MTIQITLYKKSKHLSKLNILNKNIYFVLKIKIGDFYLSMYVPFSIILKDIEKE